MKFRFISEFKKEANFASFFILFFLIFALGTTFPRATEMMIDDDGDDLYWVAGKSTTSISASTNVPLKDAALHLWIMIEMR